MSKPNTEDSNELDKILLSWFIEGNDDEDFKSTDFFHDMKNDIDCYIQSNYILKSDVGKIIGEDDLEYEDATTLIRNYYAGVRNDLREEQRNRLKESSK